MFQRLQRWRAMPKSRLEAFSDCVIAFAITLLILDIHLEDVGTNIDNDSRAVALAPRFSVYVISFLICTVAWVSHHEFIHDLDYVDPKVLWLNNLYLMWIAFLRGRSVIIRSSLWLSPFTEASAPLRASLSWLCVGTRHSQAVS
jgi:uncharacterized membrane protein